MTRALASSVVLHGILFVLAALVFALPAVPSRLKLNYVDLWPPKKESSGRSPAVLPPAIGEYPQGKDETVKPVGALKSSEVATTTVPISRVLSLGNSAPRYPEVSLAKGHEGTVVLKLRQQENGRVGEVEVVSSSGYSALDQAAIEAAARWKLGAELPSQVSVPIRFRIE